MECEVALGAANRLELKGAILVYSGGNIANGAFAAWHEICQPAAEAPRLGPAAALSAAFLRELSRGLGVMTRPEILPDNMLARTPDTLIWWTPAQRRPMFYPAPDVLGPVSGRIFPQPPLVYKVARKGLWIRALCSNRRPDADTPLSVAPYYNVNAAGLVCQGSMRAPRQGTVDSIPEWEAAFFGSEFTHLYGGGRFTRHAGGVAALWTHLAGATRFPTRTLVHANETLAQFAEREP